MRYGKARQVTLGIVAVLLAAGCSRSGDDRHQTGLPQAAVKAPSPAQETPVPEGDAFFDAPTPLPGTNPGDLVRQRPSTVAVPIPGAVKEVLVMYRTTGPDGKPVAATGVVSLPPGPAPAGGWPVMAWDHGTTGLAAKCSASRGGVPYANEDDGILTQFVKRGYAVVQPDYVGIGVNGVKHPYLNGKSAAYATLDLVRAARALDPGLSKNLFIAGQSQGAHAALWGANYAPLYAPEFDLKGVLALAPGNGFDLMPNMVASGDPTTDGYVGIFLQLVAGASAADASVKPEEFLTEKGLTAANRAWETCMDFGSEGTPTAQEVLRPGADLGPLNAVLHSSAPSEVTLKAPVFFGQGTVDPLAVLNLPLAQSMCAKGAQIEYKPYPDVSHSLTELLTAGRDEMVAWIQARLDGAPLTGTCVF